MRAIFVLFIAALLLPQVSWARRGDKGMEWQFLGKYMRESTSFSTTGAGDANYTGTSLGFESLLRISKDRYGFALKGGFASRKGNNTANTPAALESISSSVFDVGVRFYVLDVFFGFSGIYAPIAVNYARSGTVTERKYNGIGAGFELGIDLFMGDTFFVSPKLEYQTISAQPGTGTTNAERLTIFGFGIGLGLAF